MAESRIESAARAQYELETGFNWEWLDAGPEKQLRLKRASALLDRLDEADDRIRLTLDEFNAIRAEALSDLGRDMRNHFDGEQYRTIDCAGVFDFIDQRSAELSDRFIEPPNLHQAMDSLIWERVGAELEKTAEHLDAASLADVAPDTEPDRAPVAGEKTARLRRRVVNGCADWLRTRADDLRSGESRLYARVDTRLPVDEDRLTALRNAVGAEIDRAVRLAEREGRDLPAFILADELRKAVDAVTPNQNH